ncbi:hypothetical protein ADL01_13620 [Streptomyces sp. NRRL WC-3618]|uniref:hypothetical protein n=1 Tax=Streptomyces sp. NRRL WC-3618 TaxID=1519490 RepID=UPI0006B05602|nr:hypothetical protein [Streptomyces sp. NRRL WC-3618]KOV79272.1 hypothetical protein ADL01_13620 [Streptomyces sp. NRRL WC-3618]
MTWKVERVPQRPLRRGDDDRLVLPLRPTRVGDQAADTELTLTPAEAEHLHAALCRALDGHPAPPSGPECRQSIQTSSATARIVGRVDA